MLEVLMIDPQQVVFEGKALRIVLPGEQGVFEIQKHHKRIISRLLTGNIDIDNRTYPIRRGLVTMEDDKVTIVIEP